MIKSQTTFNELQEFWQVAYSKLNIVNSNIETSLATWVSNVLTSDGLSLKSPIRKLFTYKPPEPYFGNWNNSDGKLSITGKTIIVLINPGNGITYEQCNDSNISVIGRPHWHLLKEFYTTGKIEFDGKLYYLPYSRKLKNFEYNYRSGTKHFAWGWWSSQWENMLRAIGEKDEDDSFLTLELFAYSISNADELNKSTVSALRSSQLATELILDLVDENSLNLKRIILVNKRLIWEPLFQTRGYYFVPMEPKNCSGKPKAYRAFFKNQPTNIPVILLEKAQKMKFPRPENGAREIFDIL